MRVFLSYRRADVGGYAGRLHDSLTGRLGSRGVFHDVSGIGPGKDFADLIDQALDRSEALLVVIGPGWATATSAEGVRRLQQPDDFVRRELARALERDIPVVPILVGGASLPQADDLPDDVRDMTRRRAVVLHDDTWSEDVDGLVRSLRGEVDAAGPRRRRYLAASIGAAIALGVVAVGGWRLAARGSDDDGSTFPTCDPPTGGRWQPIPVGQNAAGELEIDDGTLAFEPRTAMAHESSPGHWNLMVEMSMENRTSGGHVHGDWYYDAVVIGRRAFPLSCFSPEGEEVIAGTKGLALAGFNVACEPAGYIELVLEGDRIDLTDDSEPIDC